MDMSGGVDQASREYIDRETERLGFKPDHMTDPTHPEYGHLNFTNDEGYNLYIHMAPSGRRGTHFMLYDPQGRMLVDARSLATVAKVLKSHSSSPVGVANGRADI